jgi:hypothetical protein
MTGASTHAIRRPPPWSEAELRARRPIWEALSTLFLDTDTSLLREWRANTLAASPFTVEQLEAILTDEVFPICKWNLHQVAGEWTGFDLEWLEGRIVRGRESPLRFLRFVDVRRRTAVRDAEWQATRAAVVALRTRGDTGCEVPTRRCRGSHSTRALGAYALVGCTVGPGFDFADFQMLVHQADAANALRAKWPELASWL